jgi:hypothetical protein
MNATEYHSSSKILVCEIPCSLRELCNMMARSHQSGYFKPSNLRDKQFPVALAPSITFPTPRNHSKNPFRQKPFTKPLLRETLKPDPGSSSKPRLWLQVLPGVVGTPKKAPLPFSGGRGPLGLHCCRLAGTSFGASPVSTPRRHRVQENMGLDYAVVSRVAGGIGSIQASEETSVVL